MVTVNGSTYALKYLALTETYILQKNGEPVWLIPDEIVQDVNIILAYAGAAVKFLAKNPPVSDDSKKVDILSGTKNNES